MEDLFNPLFFQHIAPLLLESYSVSQNDDFFPIFIRCIYDIIIDHLSDFHLLSSLLSDKIKKYWTIHDQMVRHKMTSV